MADQSGECDVNVGRSISGSCAAILIRGREQTAKQDHQQTSGMTHEFFSLQRMQQRRFRQGQLSTDSCGISGASMLRGRELTASIVGMRRAGSARGPRTSCCQRTARRSESARLLLRRAELILDVQGRCPALDILPVEPLPLNFENPRSIANLPLGLAELRPLEFCKQHVFRCCCIHAY